MGLHRENREIIFFPDISASRLSGLKLIFPWFLLVASFLRTPAEVLLFSLDFFFACNMDLLPGFQKSLLGRVDLLRIENFWTHYFEGFFSPCCDLVCCTRVIPWESFAITSHYFFQKVICVYRATRTRKLFLLGLQPCKLRPSGSWC